MYVYTVCIHVFVYSCVVIRRCCVSSKRSCTRATARPPVVRSSFVHFPMYVCVYSMHPLSDQFPVRVCSCPLCTQTGYASISLLTHVCLRVDIRRCCVSSRRSCTRATAWPPAVSCLRRCHAVARSVWPAHSAHGVMPAGYRSIILYIKKSHPKYPG